MDYRLKLNSSEPCDIFLGARSGKLYAIIVESRTAYVKLLDSTLDCKDFTLVCAKHSFPHDVLNVTVVDDFALIDGVACYAAECTPAAKEVLNHEISGH